MKKLHKINKFLEFDFKGGLCYEKMADSQIYFDPLGGPNDITHKTDQNQKSALTHLFVTSNAF